jgi:fructose-bisphosphate aldolase class I
MKTPDLVSMAKPLVAGDKGLLAMDESNPTCNKRIYSKFRRIVKK